MSRYTGTTSQLDVVRKFTYLGSTITDNLSLDAEIDKRTAKAATTLARLTSRVWTNSKLTMTTKRPCTTPAFSARPVIRQHDLCHVRPRGERLNTFHLRSLRRQLGISWQDKVTNTDVLSRTGLPTMYTLLR